MAEVYIDDEWVAELPEVNAAVHKAATEFQSKWKAAMLPHTRTGEFVNSIKVKRANDKDYWVYADVDYGVWVEYGHQGWVWNSKLGELQYIGPVEGIGVLRSIL